MVAGGSRLQTTCTGTSRRTGTRAPTFTRHARLWGAERHSALPSGQMIVHIESYCLRPARIPSHPRIRETSDTPRVVLEFRLSRPACSRRLNPELQPIRGDFVAEFGQGSSRGPPSLSV